MTKPATRPVVLFVCVHNAGRSQMAAALLDHHAAGRVSVRSGGSTPAEQVNPAVIAVMAELGLDLSKEFPKPLTTAAVQAADVVITMGCGDACPIFPGKRYLDWDLPDPAGRSVDDVRPIRDEIDRRVQTLLAELTEGAPLAVEPMSTEHATAVLTIYQAGLDTDDASFEATAPAWTTWDAGHLREHRFVATDADAAVLGWVACSAVSERCVYAGVVETSVYIAPEARGQGVGKALMTALIESTEHAGIWTLQTGIFPENTASIALHEAVGFRIVGRRERIGQHHGRWRDTLFLERRSTRI